MKKVLRNNKVTILVLIIAMMLSSALLIGCSGQKTTEPADTAKPKETTDEQKQEETIKDEEIVLAAPRDVAPGKEDAFFTSVILYIWEPLIGMGENGEPVPKLATSWEASEDKKEWTLKLREGVIFHNGEKFNANSVVANFNRYKKMKSRNSKFYTFNVDKVYPGLIDCEKTDDFTVKITFKNPLPTLPYNMVNFGSPIYSSDSFDENGDFVGIPSATGPFKLVEMEKDSYCVLESYKGYYGEKAKAEKIRVKVIPDAQTRYSALKAEEIMGVMDLGAITPALAEELLKDDRFEKSVEKSTISHYISANGNKPPFDNLNMRKAISLALDRQLIVDEFYKGLGKPTQNILNYASPFEKIIEHEYDIEKAKQLAKEALKGEKKDIDMIVPSAFTQKYPYKEEAEYIQATLKELGLNVNILIYDWPTFKELRKNGEFNLSMHIQGLPNMEPYSIFDRFMRSNGSTNIAYNLGYKNDRVDELMDKLDQTLDLDERAKIYDELQDLSAEELPTIPLFCDANLIVFNKKIDGYKSIIYGTTLPELHWRK
ncbi:ABC transporter substrate-binding protein [Maledivibacter halophilus]|uniref:Peptide/nickel transport system substrate-binding protein n=1 Tax=Maledivibacter halophilus TaxID=36842 RepID=A0A1T5LZL4_9FIRM|nr:ABC transporter substrate-binding protein [Maledivibacter halophilus]SKC81417.1 peptide/nickel transport system substrate-binding protein [Maledivibacter halophilus]